MKLAVVAMVLGASLCFGQDPGDFKPASSNVLDAQYPKVDSQSRVQIRFKAPPGTSHEWQTWRRDRKDFAPRLFQPDAQQALAVQRKN